MMKVLELKDKISLITEVGGGIGHVFLHHLLEKTKFLVTTSRSSREKILEPLNDVKNFTHHSLDLTQESSVKQLFNDIKEKHGRLDILINTVDG